MNKIFLKNQCYLIKGYIFIFVRKEVGNKTIWVWVSSSVISHGGPLNPHRPGGGAIIAHPTLKFLYFVKSNY